MDGAPSTSNSTSSKRKIFDVDLAEFQSRTESIRLKLESLEGNLSEKRRRPEEDYRLESLVSQSVHERYVYEKRQGAGVSGISMESTLHTKGSRVELPSIKRLETPQLVSLLNRPKRPLTSYELPRLDARIRNLSNGSTQTGTAVHYTLPPENNNRK